MKRLVSLLAAAIFLVVGVMAVWYLYKNTPITYDGSPNGTDTDVYELMQDPTNYDTSNADGIASIIVDTNLDKTRSVNDVTSIVFDYRGYDTMGEAFILIVAVTGTVAILRKSKDRWEGDDK